MKGQTARTTDLPWTPDLFDSVNLSERGVSLINRIYSNCSEEDRGYETPCYEWQGTTTKSATSDGGNYGRISIDGAMELTHRVVWACFNGFIPRKKQIDHLCRNTICCREDHLELVTNRQNQIRKNIVYKQIAEGKR